MSPILVDKEKCARDGICSAECPMALIQIQEDKYPAPSPLADQLCIRCGHCVAVCPHGAMSLDTMPADSCPPVREEWDLSADQAEHFLRSRRSIRVYKDKPVEREKLEKMIDAARHAPTGHNFQPVHWLVINNKDEVHKLAEMTIDWMKSVLKVDKEMGKAMHMDMITLAWRFGHDVVLRSAPSLIVVHGHEADLTAEKSCVIAMTYLELMARPVGLGACWAGFFEAAAQFWAPLSEALSLPAGHKCFGAMMAGYPRFRYHRLPLRREARITWR